MYTPETQTGERHMAPREDGSIHVNFRHFGTALRGAHGIQGLDTKDSARVLQNIDPSATIHNQRRVYRNLLMYTSWSSHGRGFRSVSGNL